MNRIEIETPELNEKAWSDWVEKGKLRDRVRARRWRILLGFLIALAGITGVLYVALLRQ